MISKLTIVRKNLSSTMGIGIPNIDVRSSFLSLSFLLNGFNFLHVVPFLIEVLNTDSVIHCHYDISKGFGGILFEKT